MTIIVVCNTGCKTVFQSEPWLAGCLSQQHVLHILWCIRHREGVNFTDACGNVDRDSDEEVQPEAYAPDYESLPALCPAQPLRYRPTPNYPHGGIDCMTTPLHVMLSPLLPFSVFSLLVYLFPLPPPSLSSFSLPPPPLLLLPLSSFSFLFSFLSSFPPQFKWQTTWR